MPSGVVLSHTTYGFAQLTVEATMLIKLSKDEYAKLRKEALFVRSQWWNGYSGSLYPFKDKKHYQQGLVRLRQSYHGAGMFMA